MTSVYLIRLGDTGYYKVGISRDVRARLASLQTATPHNLILLSSYEQEDALQIERDIHRALKDYQVRNEWFKCDEAMIYQLFHDYNVMGLVDSGLKDESQPPPPMEVEVLEIPATLDISPAEAAKIASLLTTLPASEVAKKLDGYSPRNYAEYKAKVDAVKAMIGGS